MNTNANTNTNTNTSKYSYKITLQINQLIKLRDDCMIRKEDVIYF